MALHRKSGETEPEEENIFAVKFSKVRGTCRRLSNILTERLLGLVQIMKLIFRESRFSNICGMAVSNQLFIIISFMLMYDPRFAKE